MQKNKIYSHNHVYDHILNCDIEYQFKTYISSNALVKSIFSNCCEDNVMMNKLFLSLDFQVVPCSLAYLLVCQLIYFNGKYTSEKVHFPRNLNKIKQ